MKISMIAAMDKNRAIGKDNAMPWHLPDDLKFFKATTLDKTVIMGRKTFESIGARPLPKRRNIVISRQADYPAKGVEVFTQIEAALNTCGADEEVIIIGGGQLYSQMLPQAHILYLTQVETEIEGDTYFPDWQVLPWEKVSIEHHQQDEKHAFAFDLITLKRVVLE